jgi:hypothetical protein
MWFSDSDLPKSLLLWDSLADVIVTSRCAHHIQDPAWRMEVMRLKHVDFGGATKVMNLHVHTKGHQSFSVDLEESLCHRSVCFLTHQLGPKMLEPVRMW